jgi:hypothetical protein
MVVTRKVYTKDELHVILSKRCPTALAIFPPPHTFSIRVHKKGNPSLEIGHSITKGLRKSKYVLWMKEYAMHDQAVLYFTAEDGSDYLTSSDNKFAYRGNELFEKLSNDGIVQSPVATHALYRYIMLMCGHATEFKDKDTTYAQHRKVSTEGSLRRLIWALRQIEKRTVVSENSSMASGSSDEEDNSDMDNHRDTGKDNNDRQIPQLSTDDAVDEPLVSQERKKRRASSIDAENPSAVKRTRNN